MARQLAVFFFAGLVLVCETLLFHVTKYVLDYIPAMAVISCAVAGIGLGAFLASRLPSESAEHLRLVLWRHDRLSLPGRLGALAVAQPVSAAAGRRQCLRLSELLHCAGLCPGLGPGSLPVRHAGCRHRGRPHRLGLSMAGQRGDLPGIGHADSLDRRSGHRRVFDLAGPLASVRLPRACWLSPAPAGCCCIGK